VTGRQRRSSQVLPSLLGLLLAALLSGCVAPAFTQGAYRENAKQALGSALSEARTAVTALDARLAGNVTVAFADTVVSGSEDALSSIQASFGSVDPTTRSLDPLRTKVMNLLSSVADELSVARIAVRRDDPAGMRRARDDLHRLGSTLERAQGALS
jgi:hypothetical protein